MANTIFKYVCRTLGKWPPKMSQRSVSGDKNSHENEIFSPVDQQINVPGTTWERTEPI